MNYSTYNSSTFFIKKNSTFPELKFPLTQKLLEKYNILEDMLQNIAVTFSMVNEENGSYVVANTAGGLSVNDNLQEYPYIEKYNLTYQFTKNQTKKTGIFLGEFVIDFLDPNYNFGKIKLPESGNITIVINDTITNTTVI